MCCCFSILNTHSIQVLGKFRSSQRTIVRNQDNNVLFSNRDEGPQEEKGIDEESRQLDMECEHEGEGRFKTREVDGWFKVDRWCHLH